MPESAREKILGYLRSEMVGPAVGCEEILELDPVDRYCTGVLYPQGIAVGDSVASGQSDDAVTEEGEGGAEAPDRDEGVGDGALRTAHEQRPSSQGISFVVAGSDSVAFEVTVRCARYRRNGAEESWARSIHQWKARFEAPLGGHSAIVDDRSGSGALEGVRINARIRPQLHGELGNIAIVTVTLINARSAGQAGWPDAEDCIFESEFDVEACAACRFVRYVGSKPLSYDPEEEELELRFADRRHFAIGHGAGASWSEPKEGTTRMVSAVAIPQSVVRGLTGEIDGVDQQTLSLQWLSDPRVAPAEVRRGLNSICDRYREWISEQAGSSVPPRLASARDRLLERQRAADTRIRRGIELAFGERADPRITRAFRLANEAVLRQMIMSGDGFGKTAHERDDAEPRKIDIRSAEWATRRWRPFQIAFLLLTIPSLVRESEIDKAERELVDLLWFPTGGGKTEAYLAVIAFEAFRRRLIEGARGAGTVAIKRYTLRLLTTQQFSRAAALICAMELMRREDEASFGKGPFRLGLWIGQDQTPNNYANAHQLAQDVRASSEPVTPFQLTHCPRCGTASVPRLRSGRPDDYGFDSSGDHFTLFCPNVKCPFHRSKGGLPVNVVDEALYQDPPTLLIATIDKFARLPWEERSLVFFGGDRNLPPSLVIQDELHLISGPLGTIAGVYEPIVDLLCSRDGTGPKIIAATATIRRAEDQCRALYGRGVVVFPPPGVSASDSFFSRDDETSDGRLYVGVMPQGVKRQTAMVRTCAALWQAPKSLDLTGAERDAYWTLVAYHNSRRELGKTMTALLDDVVGRIDALVEDRALRRTQPNVPVTVELSSQAAATEPGGTAAIIQRVSLPADNPAVVDALPCTNMISVGVDISRLSLMLIYGQPKTTAEYIQASSRVGRDATRPPGVVFVLLSGNKPRDRSHFEMFCGFHESIYRFVEPSSVTPYSPPALRRALAGTLVGAVRLVAGLIDNGAASKFRKDDTDIARILTALQERIRAASGKDADVALRELNRLVKKWHNRAAANVNLRFVGRPGVAPSLLAHYDPSRGLVGADGEFVLLDSMRNVDAESPVIVRSS